MVSRKFVKCFKQLHFKEHFRTVTFEIIFESRPFLKKCGLLQYFNGKGLSQSHLSTEVPLENKSWNNLFVSWWKKVISHTPKIEVAPTSFILYLFIISVIPCSDMQKIVCPRYLLCDFHKRDWLELLEKFTVH